MTSNVQSVKKTRGRPKSDLELREWILSETRTMARETEEADEAEDRSLKTPAEAMEQDRRGKWEWARAARRLGAAPPDAQPGGGVSIRQHKKQRMRHHHAAAALRLHGDQREVEALPGSVYLVGSDGAFLKLPIPSDTPDDPLSWGKWKRRRAMVCIVMFRILGMSLVQMPQMNFRLLEDDPTLADRGSVSLEQLLIFPTLTIGLGAFFWTPLSVAVGRRPVFLMSMVLLFVGATIAATAKNFVTLLGAVILQGFGAAPAWSLMILMVTDMTFIHERPQALSAYWSVGGAAILATLAAVPRITTKVFQGNWRGTYWMWTGMLGLCFAVSFFLLPESYFVRPAVAFDGKILLQSAGEKVHIYDEGQVRQPDTQLSARKRRWAQLSSWKEAGACYPQIALCMANPLVFWVTLLNTLAFAGVIAIAQTYPGLLTAAPYNVDPAHLGFVTLSAAGGALMAWPACGLLISECLHGLTRRNGGLRHAEFYLPAFVLPVVAGVTGLVLFGVTAQRHLDRALIYVAYALMLFSFEGGSVASTLWVTEAFPQWATAALIVVGGLSYVLSFGVTFAVPKMLAFHGYEAACVGLACGILVLGVVAVPIAFWGRDFRQYVDGRWGRYEGGALRPQK